MADSVLIIGGEPDFQERLRLPLTEAGFSVACVSDYLEALLKLDEFEPDMPDMIIVDEALPGGDGTEVCSQLHSTFGIPVILLGRDSSGKAWKKAVEAGADFYLRKPFSRQVLVARVKAILRRYKLSASGSKNGL